MPKPRSPRYETLTAWRGIACLMIVIFHSLFTGYGLAFPGGVGQLGGVLEVLRRFWIGVPLFFVISGYCVTASADWARRQPNPGPNFFFRRFRRIYPPYWVWLAITGFTVWKVENAYPGFFGKAFLPNPRDFTKWQWLGNFTLTETWRWHIVRGTESELIAPSWTLCYEEQFYLLTGITLIFARRFFFGAFALITVMVVAGLFVLPINTLGLFLDGKWLMFAAGILVYYTLNYVPQRSIGWFCIPLGLGILCSLTQPEHLLKPDVNEPNQSYLCAFSFALALIAVRRWDIYLARAWVVRPLAYCGEMCYSIYLIHWPTATVVSWGFRRLELQNPYAILVLGLSCCLIAVLVLARGFHKLVERRFWNRSYSNSSTMEKQAIDGQYIPQRLPHRF